MATYLVHKTLQGRPIGIFSETGEDYYDADFEQSRGVARRLVPETMTKPWAVFVEEKSRSFNHRFFWASVEDDRSDLEEILQDLQTRHRDG